MTQIIITPELRWLESIGAVELLPDRIRLTPFGNRCAGKIVVHFPQDAQRMREFVLGNVALHDADRLFRLGLLSWLADGAMIDASAQAA